MSLNYNGFLTIQKVTKTKNKLVFDYIDNKKLGLQFFTPEQTESFLEELGDSASTLDPSREKTTYLVSNADPSVLATYKMDKKAGGSEEQQAGKEFLSEVFCNLINTTNDLSPRWVPNNWDYSFVYEVDNIIERVNYTLEELEDVFSSSESQTRCVERLKASLTAQKLLSKV